MTLSRVSTSAAVICAAVALLGAADGSSGAGSARPSTGALEFRTSDPALLKAFEWARNQALAYAFEGDPVGDWFEAALPGRQAFCMRDVSHQATGAHLLGLARHNLNMLGRFAAGISESRDWCSFWEINRHGLPAPADYETDADFWYNLPANFDVLDTCYRMYVWSGDRTYVEDPTFVEFYRRSVHDYVDRWDLGLDRIMNRERMMNPRGRPGPNRRFESARGIPGYDESDEEYRVGLDQLATQFAGYLSYARLSKVRGDEAEAARFEQLAGEVKALVNQKWWDDSARGFYSHLNTNGKFVHRLLEQSVLYWGVAEDGPKLKAALAALVRTANDMPQDFGIEAQSHFPEILYRYGEADAGYRQILDLTRESKPRCEYPEVSYSVVGAFVTGLMGIEAPTRGPLRMAAEAAGVSTVPHLTGETEWAEIANVPISGNLISVRHDGVRKSTLRNERGPALIWKACLPGSFKTLTVNGRAATAREEDPYSLGRKVSTVRVVVGAGDTVTVEAVR